MADYGSPMERMQNNIGVLSQLTIANHKCSITRVAFIVTKILAASLHSPHIENELLDELRSAVAGDNHSDMTGVAVNYMAKSVLAFAEATEASSSPAISSSASAASAPLFIPDNKLYSMTPSSQATPASTAPEEDSSGAPSPTSTTDAVEPPPSLVVKHEPMAEDFMSPFLPKGILNLEDVVKILASANAFSSNTATICRRCGTSCPDQSTYAMHMKMAHPRVRDPDMIALQLAANASSMSSPSTSGPATPIPADGVPRKKAKKEKDPSAPSGINMRPYNCRHCGLLLESQQAYASHVRYTHPKAPGSAGKELLKTLTPKTPREDNAQADIMMVDGRKIYECRRCRKHFESAQGIAGHMRCCKLAHPDSPMKSPTKDAMKVINSMWLTEAEPALDLSQFDPVEETNDVPPVKEEIMQPVQEEIV